MASEAKKRLRPPHRDFIANYTDKQAKTYANATQSYMGAYPSASYQTAQVNGSRLLADTKISSAIDEILEDAQAGYKVRLQHLIQLALGRHQTSATTEQYDADNNLVSKQMAYRDVSPADRIKALKVLSDLTGETELSRARAEVMSKELHTLSKSLMSRAERVVSGVEGGNGGGEYSIHSPSETLNPKKVDPPEGNPEASEGTPEGTPEASEGTREDLGIIDEKGEFDE